jgi:hypothetical protein
MLYNRLISRPGDAYDIEAGISLVQIFLVQEKLSGEDHAPLLSRFYSF